MKSVCLDTQYLILSEQVVVAQDLAQILAGHDARATVLLTRTVAEAFAVIDGVAHLSLGFVQIKAGDRATAGQIRVEMARRIAERGGQMVLIGADLTAAPGEPWIVLPAPFSTDAVLRLMGDLVPA